MIGWRLVRLNELGTVERGRSRHRPRDDPKLYGGPYPFIQTGDVKSANLRINEVRQTYSEDGLSQSRLWPAGTLCITIAANICDTAILSFPACFPDSIVGFTPHQGSADVVFIKYSLDMLKEKFTAISRGATQDNLSLEKLLSQDLYVPALEHQRRIASILGAYDDLIEVNRRQIAVLETMARELFEEWFDNPGLKGAVDGNGELREGWRIGTFGELAVNVGASLSPGSAPDRMFAHYSLPAFDDGQRPVLERGDSIMSAKLRFEPPAILVSKLNPRIPRVWHVKEDPGYPQICSTEFVPLAPRDRASASFLLVCASAPQFRERLAGISGGTSTSHQRVKPSDILNTPVVIPPSDVLDQANAHLEPLCHSIEALRASNSVLGRARDLLLPRLISGELSVTAAERELEEAA